MDRTSQFEIQLSNRTGAVFSGRPFFEQKGSFMAKKIIRLPRTKEQKQANRERNERANRTILSRTLILMVLCGVIAFVPLIGTLYNLMITQHDYYNEKAIKNQTRSTNLTAARGVIYDANMNVLASSSTVETVFIDPNEIAEQMKKPENSNLLDQIARGLGEILDVEPSFVYEQAADKQYRYKVISRKISEELADESAPSSAKTRSPASISKQTSSAITPTPPSPRRHSASSQATTTAPRALKPITTKSFPAQPGRS